MPSAPRRPALPHTPWTWRTAWVFLLVGACSWMAREALHRRVELPSRGAQEADAWVSSDPDSLYHMRRVERALDSSGAIANRDPFLNHPEGSAIPWPPYYTRVLATLLAPFAPRVEDGPGGRGSEGARRRRHAWIERSVASLPLVFGVLTSLLAALTARRLAGDLAALAAGGYHALCLASIAYSKSGNGDHHAWVSLLAGALVAILCTALARGAHRRPKEAWAWGGLLGLLAGTLLGSWVASLVYIVEVQLVLAWLILRNGQDPLSGLPALGGAFHLAALATCLPAVLDSPWRLERPWQTVNLSWFHPTFLLVGALVFLPLPWVRQRPKARRAYPWGVLASLLGLAGLLTLLDTPAARGVREGFDWIGKVNSFMAGISESRPLLTPRAFTELGFGLLLLPVAWGALLWSARPGRPALRAAWIPLVVAVLLRSVQAGAQARFGDALTLPIATLLGIGAPWLFTRLRLGGKVRALSVLGTALLVGLLHPRVCAALATALRGERAPQVERDGAARVAAREACEWLASSMPPEDVSALEAESAPGRAPQANGPGGAVLANWSFGHCIEWAAGRPSLATNFGTYVGEEGFRTAPRFLLGRADDVDWSTLDRAGVEFVLVTSLLPKTLSSQISAAGREAFGGLLEHGPQGTNIRGEWFDTLGARLLRGGRGGVPGSAHPGDVPALERLRLVYVSRVRDPEWVLPGEGQGPQPAALLWQLVPGALLEARGEPGTLLSVDLTLRFPRARYTAHYRHSARADAAGVARLRIPYATADPTGNGKVPPDRARVRFGERSAALDVPERAVLAGERVLPAWD